MASEIQGKKMSEYTPLNELTQQEQVTYLSNAAVTTFGKTSTGGKNTNVNIPLSTLVPSVPVTDVTVNGSSVVSNGVAAITVPTTSVPDPGTNLHRGEFLKVNNEDDIVWSAVPVPELRGSDTVTYDASNSGALAVKYNTNTLDEDSTHGLTVKLPVPDTTGANEGDVLTVESNGDIDWVAPSGGGGGGNPYTKVNVTPGDCYLNGEKSSYDFDLYDQDVTISNNTYSVLPSPIGYYPTVEEPEYRYQHNLDNLVIKLPDDTAFPMAVVEFTVKDDDYYAYQGCVNNVKVKVGNTELTRMYSAPYNPNTLLLSGENNDEFEYWKLVTEENHGNPYYRIEQVMSANKGTENTAFMHGTKVQVHIFGSCFNITVSQACGEPSAS